MANQTKRKTTKNETVKETDVMTALTKKALGYEVQEIIEEYSVDENNNERLMKKKVTTKSVPPDITAVKVILELENLNNNQSLKDLTDEELDEKINQIIKQIKENENDSNDWKNESHKKMRPRWLQ